MYGNNFKCQRKINSLLKFLLFFFIAVVAIVLAVFFNYEVPKKENIYLKEVTADYKQHMTSEQKFTALLEEANGKLDSLDQPGVDLHFLNGQIGATLGKIDNADLSKEDKMFLNIILKYHEAKKKLIELRDAADKYEKLKNDYTQCQNELRDTKTNLQICLNRGN